MSAHIKSLSLNYVWGIANFTAGVIITSAVIGLAAGMGGLCR